ncbi:MAG: adenylate kinase [Bradyrhizobium sp.]|nr:adenylate kinase [Bradyrhizobium sp.]
MIRLALIGLPTSGKSTLSNQIAVAADVPQINVGHCLRVAAANDAALDERLNQGAPVDDGMVADAVRVRLAAADGYVLDGFPRSTSQLAISDGWQAARNCSFVLLDLDGKSIRECFLGRMNCSACRRADYGSTVPRTCGVCGQPLKPRNDATEQALDAKLAAFHDHEEPLVRELERQARLVRIGVTGNAEDDFHILMKALRSIDATPDARPGCSRPATR